MFNFQSTVTNQAGRPLSGASVTVYLAGTATPATLYSDNGVTTSTNPVTTDSNGRFSFYIADGLYDFQYSGTAITTWLRTNQLIASGHFQKITATSATMLANGRYIANNASLVTLTMPAAAAVGDIVEVVGLGAGGWKIAQNAGDIIHFDNADTTTGTSGYVQSTKQRDSIKLVCVVANDEWQVVSAIGIMVIN
jgi:hypothetical protein